MPFPHGNFFFKQETRSNDTRYSVIDNRERVAPPRDTRSTLCNGFAESRHRALERKYLLCLKPRRSSLIALAGTRKTESTRKLQSIITRGVWKNQFTCARKRDVKFYDPQYRRRRKRLRADVDQARLKFPFGSKCEERRWIFLRFSFSLLPLLFEKEAH